MGEIGLRGTSRRMREISLFVTFFFFFLFLHHAYRSPWLTDFHDLYVKRRVFAQGSAFWGLDDEFSHLPPFFPQNLKICITAYGNFERQ